MTEDDDMISSRFHDRLKSPISAWKYSREESERKYRENHIQGELAAIRKKAKEHEAAKSVNFFLVGVFSEV